MTFYMDTRFIAYQFIRFRQIAAVVLANWNTNYTQLNNSACRSSYKSFVTISRVSLIVKSGKGFVILCRFFNGWRAFGLLIAVA